MNTIYHFLVDASTSKVFNITVAGTNVTTESGMPGKTRVTEKVFAERSEALKFFYKKEWEMLKKGFVLYNQSAKLDSLYCIVLLAQGTPAASLLILPLKEFMFISMVLIIRLIPRKII
jgi:hypothetical protein